MCYDEAKEVDTMVFQQKEPIQKGWSGDKKFRITDENGTAEFRGFYGDYCANVEFGVQEVKTEFSLSKNAENSTRITL